MNEIESGAFVRSFVDSLGNDSQYGAYRCAAHASISFRSKPKLITVFVLMLSDFIQFLIEER